MFLILLFIGVLILINVNKAQKRAKECIGKHSWVVRFENNDKRGYLVCAVCGKIPG